MAAQGPLREFGNDPVSGRPVVARDGRFGVYVTDGETNASIGRGDRIEEMAPERAFELLAVRREQVAAKGGTPKPAKRARGQEAPGQEDAGERRRRRAAEGASDRDRCRPTSPSRARRAAARPRRRRCSPTRSTPCSRRRPEARPSARRLRQILHDNDVVELDARAEALIAAADRAQHIAEVVLPALRAGRSVVSDRSVYSTLAYQGYGRQLDLAELRRINDWAVQGVWPIARRVHRGPPRRRRRPARPPARPLRARRRRRSTSASSTDSAAGGRRPPALDRRLLRGHQGRGRRPDARRRAPAGSTEHDVRA